MLTKDMTDVGQTLNELVQACNDSAMRFHDAVGRIENSELRRICHEFERRREAFALELRNHVGRFGEDPTDSGTVTETLRRAGRELKSLVLQPDDLREIVACAAGDDSARKRFHRAIADVPDSVRPMIERQHQEIAENCKLLKDLQKSLSQDADARRG